MPADYSATERFMQIPGRTHATQDGAITAEHSAPEHAMQTAGRVDAAPVAESQAPALRTEKLSAWYGDHLAIRDVDLNILANRVTAIIGPSGCGKSTALRCLNRMHEVIRGTRVAGRVLLDDEDIYAPEVDAVRVRRRIGMVFQKPNPFPMMSIFDNVVAGLKLTGETRGADLQATVEHSLRAVALWEEVKDKLRQ